MLTFTLHIVHIRIHESFQGAEMRVSVKSL